MWHTNMHKHWEHISYSSQTKSIDPHVLFSLGGNSCVIGWLMIQSKSLLSSHTVNRQVCQSICDWSIHINNKPTKAMAKPDLASPPNQGRGMFWLPWPYPPCPSLNLDSEPLTLSPASSHAARSAPFESWQTQTRKLRSMVVWRNL